MPEDFRLPAEPRELLGSAHSRRMRQQGRVPGNLYGFKKQSLNISVSADDIEQLLAGKSKVVDVEIDGEVDKAVVQELQWNVFSTFVKHIDLKRVDTETMTTAEVPVVLHGDAAGLKVGGQLRQPTKFVSVTCQDFRVPKNVIARVAKLGIGDSMTVGDLIVPETVKVETDASTVVAEVFNPKKAEVAAEEESE